MDRFYRRTSWYLFLDTGMRELVDQSFRLLDDEANLPKNRFRDYSYLVFPIARAYEGFLKKLFESLGLIDQYQLLNPHFRIGRSLNPDLPEKFRDQSWLFDDLHKIYRDCGQPQLAMDMWEAWREGRNQLFHYYFSAQEHFTKLEEADKLVHNFAQVMAKVIDCDPSAQVGELKTEFPN